jgi:hypothetical protein
LVTKREEDAVAERRGRGKDGPVRSCCLLWSILLLIREEARGQNIPLTLLLKVGR